MLQALFSQEGLLFTIPGIVGAAIFLLRMAAMVVGGAAEGMDLDADVDFDVDAADAVDAVDAVHTADAADFDLVEAADAGDATESFRLISIQSIAAFLMGFGAGGLAAYFGFEWSLGYAALAGAVFGAFLMWLMAILMKAVYDLQSSGNVDIRDAVGRDAVVYTSIPASGSGSGQVRVVINNRMRLYNAISEDGAIASQSRVKVVRANSDATLSVRPVAST